MNTWQSNSVGDTVRITVSPERGEYVGTITAISEVPSNGDYPIFTVDVPAYGTFTRPADEVIRRVAVTLHLDIAAVDQPSEVAKEIHEEILRSYQHIYPVIDWDVERED